MGESNFNLKKCFECVALYQAVKYGRQLIPEKIEKRFVKIRSGKAALSWRILKQLKNSKTWIFDDYWVMPSRHDLIKTLHKAKKLFPVTAENEKDVIRNLCRIFKNIEVVSILLRFIDPVNYGVMSPPVKYAIQSKLHSGWDYVGEYCEYLSLLREYKAEHGFARTADLETALWVLVEKCLRGKDIICDNLVRFRDEFLTVEERLQMERYMEQDYQEKISMLEGEIKKYEQEKNELEDTYIEDLFKLEKEKTDMNCLLSQSQDEIQRLEKNSRTFSPELLFNIKDSPRRPEDKLIHENGHEVDHKQRMFMMKLSQYVKIHHIIWSENMLSKPPTRLADVKASGEVTIYYVGSGNYTAKIKVFPFENLPDNTHARYFSLLIAKHMGIKNSVVTEKLK